VAADQGGNKEEGLLPIEWVRREKKTPSPRPRGGIPPGAGQPRREKSGVPERRPGFRKAPVPEPFA
jgi:hypothetical protein